MISDCPSPLTPLPLLNWATMSVAEQRAALARPAVQSTAAVEQAVRTIVSDVEQRGDEAVRDWAKRLDGFSDDSWFVSPAEWAGGVAACSPDLMSALELAAANIRRFHQGEVPAPHVVEVMPGVRCQRLWRPLGRVGLYVPAGTAPLPSTVLMLGIPAAIAGVAERVVVTPVGKTGVVAPAILAAAQVAGVTQIVKIGGAHAIAALAYGTESLPKVDKIFGPGNAYVTAAKALVAQSPRGAAVDMPAGPSEVLVVADETARPAFAAADLLSQAEHGVDSQVVLVAFSARQARATLAALAEQLESLPRRAIATASLRHARVILVRDRAEALAVVNAYAPEHLILQVAAPSAWLPAVHHAGSVFLGHLTPEAVGDYASGTNHVLPTYGWARSHSALGVEAFMKALTVQEVTPEGLALLAPAVTTLAAVEQLAAHARAITIRLASSASEGDQ